MRLGYTVESKGSTPVRHIIVITVPRARPVLWGAHAPEKTFRGCRQLSER